jgi:hypothetical protein
MNVTISIPADVVPVERRHATLGATGVVVELQDGTRIEITEKDGGIMVAALAPHTVLTLTPYTAHAVQISAARYEEEEPRDA